MHFGEDVMLNCKKMPNFGDVPRKMQKWVDKMVESCYNGCG